MIQIYVLFTFFNVKKLKNYCTIALKHSSTEANDVFLVLVQINFLYVSVLISVRFVNWLNGGICTVYENQCLITKNSLDYVREI